MVNRRRGIGRKTYGPDMHTFLEYGFCFGRRRVLDIGDASEAWAVLREKVTAEHVADSTATRPWGWWMFSAPAELQEEYGGGRIPRGVGDQGLQTILLAAAGLLSENELRHLRLHGRPMTEDERSEVRGRHNGVCPVQSVPWEESQEVA